MPIIFNLLPSVGRKTWSATANRSRVTQQSSRLDCMSIYVENLRNNLGTLMGNNFLGLMGQLTSVKCKHETTHTLVT